MYMGTYFLPVLLFNLSLLGMMINSTNILLLLICMEMMLLSVCLSFLMMTYTSKNLIGLIMFMFMITVAAVESAMGLSMMISFYKVKGSISISFLNTLKG